MENSQEITKIKQLPSQELRQKSDEVGKANFTPKERLDWKQNQLGMAIRAGASNMEMLNKRMAEAHMTTNERQLVSDMQKDSRNVTIASESQHLVNSLGELGHSDERIIAVLEKQDEVRNEAKGSSSKGSNNELEQMVTGADTTPEQKLESRIVKGNMEMNESASNFAQLKQKMDTEGMNENEKQIATEMDDCTYHLTVAEEQQYLTDALNKLGYSDEQAIAVLEKQDQNRQKAKEAEQKPQ